MYANVEKSRSRGHTNPAVACNFDVQTLFGKYAYGYRFIEIIMGMILHKKGPEIMLFLREK